MKVGDLVLRSYKHEVSPGIIVEYVSQVLSSYDGDDFYEDYYIVSWPDGSLTNETIWEVELYEEVAKREGF